MTASAPHPPGPPGALRPSDPDASGPWLDACRGAGLVGPDGDVRPNVFAEMSALATATGAINLGQGFPNYTGPAGRDDVRTLVRFAYCKDDATLAEAVRRLRTLGAPPADRP